MLSNCYLTNESYLPFLKLIFEKLRSCLTVEIQKLIFPNFTLFELFYVSIIFIHLLIHDKEIIFRQNCSNKNLNRKKDFLSDDRVEKLQG